MPKKDNAASRVDAQLNLLFYALGHPVRRWILRILATQTASALTLSQRINATAPVASYQDISYHLNDVLAKKCHLVELVEINQRRGAREKVYSIRNQRLWVPTLSGGLSHQVDQALAVYSHREFVIQLLAALEQGPPDVVSWRPVEVDREGWDQVLDAARHFDTCIAAAAARTEMKQVRSVEDSYVRVVTGIAAFSAGSPNQVASYSSLLKAA